MRHKVAGRKLNRTTNQRKALFRNLVADLLLRERITTTEAKAKAVRGLIDRVISRAKVKSESHKRYLSALLPRKDDLIRKLTLEIAPRFANRPSGFTRIIKLGARPGDNAPMVIMELVVREEKKAQKPKKTKGTEEIGGTEEIKKIKAPEKSKKVIKRVIRRKVEDASHKSK